MRSEFAKQVRSFIWAMFVIVGLLLLCSEPAEAENWGRVFLESKVEGFGCWGIAVLLYKFWEPRGLLPKELSEDMKEE